MTRWIATILMLTPAVALAAEEGGNPTPFAGTLAQSIAAIVVFLIVFFVLKAKAWGPILKGLQDREEKIRKDLQDAEQAREAAQAKLAEYQKQLADAEAKVRDIFAKATADAEAAGTRIKMQAQQEAEQLKERAMAEIEQSRRNALAELQQQAVSLATAMAGKILRRQITEADQAELIKSSLAELQAASKN